MAVSLVSVLVVSYRTREWVLEGLAAWRESPPRTPVEVLVLDNGTGELLPQDLEAFPFARLHRSSRNLGFGSGTNLLAREASGELLLLLNPDARPTPGALDSLVGYLSTHPEMAACGPRIEDPKGATEWSCFRLPSDPWEVFLHQSNLRRGILLRVLPTLRLEGWSPNEPVDVEGISAAVLLIRREAYTEIAGFDEAFFLYWEDFDLCQRLAEAGLRVAFVPSATFIHGRSQSYVRGDLRVFLEGYRALRVYLTRHFPQAHTAHLRLAAWLWESAKALLMPRLLPRIVPLARVLFSPRRDAPPPTQVQ